MESKWRDITKVDKDKKDFDMLEKLNKSVETVGVNITLKWQGCDDLDIHTKCLCDWTRVSSSIKCVKCKMERDIDMRYSNNRKR